VCFNAPVVETFRRPDATRHPGLRGLGPDLSRPDADLSRCVDALLAHDDPTASIAEVLLDSRVFCGVGNVYRSELLWANELSPFARVGDLPEGDVVRLVNLAARLLRVNLREPQHVTLPKVGDGLAVYGRTGQPCPRCATTIRSREAGAQRRTLYWCPGCQLRLDPRLLAARTEPLPPPMDPHPAAQHFLSELPWRQPA
jgi:endonuclease-8